MEQAIRYQPYSADHRTWDVHDWTELSLVVDNTPVDKSSSPENIDIIAFDFDGTITIRDTFALFLRYYAGTARWALNILVLLPVFIAYGLRLIHRDRVKIQVIRRFFKNAPVSTLDSRAAQFATDVIPNLIRDAARTALQTKIQQGETVILCSASIAPYLRPWAEANGIKTVLATELEAQNGVYTGEIEGWNIWGTGKTRRIAAEYAPKTVIIKEAYGDSAGDRPMLLAAKASYWRPFRV